MRMLASVVAKPLSCLAIACLGLLSGTAAQAQNVIAGPIVNPNNNHTYYLLEPATWTAAEAKAVALGGHLATVRNLTENNWIYTQFSAFSHAGSTARGLWIGLNDATTEGTYLWSSNEINSYTNWGAGEPVNQDGTDDYVHLFYPGDPRQSQWNDAPNITNIGAFPLNGVVEVLPAADLSVTKSCATNGAQSVLCTVTVTNIGTVASVAPMSITDTLTSSTSNNANLTGAGGTLPASCSPGAQLITNIPLTCPSINTSLAAGASGTLLISYTMPQGGTFTNCVSVTQAQNASTPGDPNASNNTNICTTFSVSAPPPTTGSITIVKDASPDDAQDFTFTSNQASIAPFPLDDDSNSTLSNQRTFSPLPASTYTFTETQVSGWTLSNLVCTGGTATTNLSTATATITLTAGANVICTFTNTKQTTGTLTIVKDALSNDAQDFAFYAFGSTSGSINPFQLDDDAGATGANTTLSNSQTFSTLAAGTYSVKEDFFNPVTVTGWTLTSLACVNASGAAVGTIDMSINAFTVALAAGDNVTCTFTNTRNAATGSITIVKDASPDDAQDFTFTSNQASIAPFPLDDDSNSTLSNQRTFSPLPASTYTFTETQVSGWTLSNIVCTGGTATTNLTTATASITLTAGANVICTFTNTKQTTGTLTIVKDAAINDAQDFAFYAFGSTSGSINPFQLDDDSGAVGASSTLSNSQTFSTLAPGTYSVKEDFFNPVPVTGWTLTSIACVKASGAAVGTIDMSIQAFTVTLAAGDNVTCTFTNSKVTTGTLTIVKNAATNDAQDFAFYAFGSTSGSINPFQLDDDAGATGANTTLSNSQTFSTLAPGTYSVKEDFFNPVTVTGWTLTSLACVKASGAAVGTIDMSIMAFTVTLAAGDNVTCTFTNTKTPATGSITIVKDAQPNDEQNFTFTSNQASIAPFPLDDDSEGTLSNQRTFATLPAGTYSFSETQVSGWTLSGVTCVGGTTTTSIANGSATITLAGGDNVTCTFTNTRARTGTLTIIKDAQQDDAQDFHFAVSGSGLTAFDLDDDGSLANPLSNSITFSNLTPGIALTVTEDAVAGWTVPSIQCLVSVPGQTTTFTDQLNRTFTVNLEAGANVTCTFINVKTTGSITIVKDTQPNHEQDFTFTSNQASIAPFPLDDDSNNTLSNQRTFAPLPAGTYSFTETPTTGWTLSGLVCSGGTATTNLVTGTATITLTAGSNVTCTFANSRSTVATAKVCGVKFNDLDGDGVQDASDLGLPNWQISVGVATIPPVVTGTKGEYCFDALPAGTYTIAEIPQAPWVQTYPAAPGVHSVNLQAGQVLNGVNFGNTIPAGNCNPLTGTSYSLVLNGNFELAPIVAANSFNFIDDSLITGWETSASNSLIEVWGSNYQGVSAYSGNQFIELNATAGATVYQDFTATPGSTLTITFAHRGRRGFANQMSVAIGAVGNLATTVGTYTAIAESWTLNTITWTAPLNGGTAYQIGFVPGDNSAGGNFLDAIQIIDQSCKEGPLDEATILPDLHVFNFFEDKYPVTFTGTFSTGIAGKYKFRFYKDTGNYLALDDMGAVYMRGPVSDNQITALGSAADLRATILQWNTGPVPTERVFAFIEANLPGLFRGQGTPGKFEQYTYRFYAATGNALAVDNAGMIYLRGPSTGNAIVSVGTVESYRTAINNWYKTLTP